MAKIKYPFKAFVLTPSMQIKQISVTGEYWRKGYQVVEGNKVYHDSELHATRAAAIAAGTDQLDKHESRLAKQREGISKKRANLAEAAQEI